MFDKKNPSQFSVHANGIYFSINEVSSTAAEQLRTENHINTLFLICDKPVDMKI